MAPKKKAEAPQAPKPSLYTEEEWALAHNGKELMDILSASDRASANSKGNKPPVSKATAAAWLWRLAGSTPTARDEAFKGGVIDIAARQLASCKNPSLLTSLLGIISTLCGPDITGSQAAAVREALLAARPPLLPSLLNQLEDGISSPLKAAALDVLLSLVGFADTQLRVTKIMAAGNQQALVSALSAQQCLPLEGGRNASASAAAILQVLCAPIPAAAGGPTAGNKETDAGNGSSLAAAAAANAGGADATLTAAVQQKVLAASGLQALLKVCQSRGSTAAARASAAAALAHLMVGHGHIMSIKDAFQTANGLSIMARLLLLPTLPDKVKAAAAACIVQYLAPAKSSAAAVSVTPGTTGTPAQGAASASTPSMMTSATAAAKQHQQPGAEHDAASSSTSGSRLNSPDLGVSRKGPMALLMAPAGTQMLGTPDSAAYQAALAVWDHTSQAAFAERAERVVKAGCVPVLLLQCCGLNSPPPGLRAAAQTAITATCDATGKGQSAGTKQQPTAVSSTRRRSINDGSVAAGPGGVGPVSTGGSDKMEAGVLGAIAEPLYGEIEEVQDDLAEAVGAAVNEGGASAGSGNHGSPAAASTRKSKKGKWGPRLDPSTEECMRNASAAVKLLAMSGDCGQTALVAAGALPVLVALLDDPVPVVRWNARQAAMTLAAMDKGKAQSTTNSLHSSTVTRPNTVGSAIAQPTPLAAALAAAVASSSTSQAGPASLTALFNAPAYVSMENMPASHWQRTAPIQMVPLPVLPVLPVTPLHGRKTQDQQPGVPGAGGAGLMGSTAAPGGRLTGQRRVSVTSTAGAALAASRMSISNSSYATVTEAGSEGVGSCGGKLTSTLKNMSAMHNSTTMASLAGSAGSASSDKTIPLDKQQAQQE